MTAHPMVLSVINLKGGTSKTTSAVYIAHALHEMGKRVLLVDADPQASAATWQDSAPEVFPFTLLRLPSKRLHTELPDHMRNQYEVVVIDTPPLEQQTGIVTSALWASSFALIPVAPTAIEIERLYAVRQVLDDASTVRPEPLPAGVLFTRVIPNASSTDAFREQLTSDGFWVLDATVGRLERFGQAYGENITDASQTAYGFAVNELLNRKVAA